MQSGPYFCAELRSQLKAIDGASVAGVFKLNRAVRREPSGVFSVD